MTVWGVGEAKEAYQGVGGAMDANQGEDRALDAYVWVVLYMQIRAWVGLITQITVHWVPGCRSGCVQGHWVGLLSGGLCVVPGAVFWVGTEVEEGTGCKWVAVGKERGVLCLWVWGRELLLGAGAEASWGSVGWGCSGQGQPYI